ncbi:MAG: Bacitracin transport permease protein BCRC [uncultured bacterium]|nr:MAG: Bacitracin transport permease protein BCRC [uncultured bacterium]
MENFQDMLIIFGAKYLIFFAIVFAGLYFLSLSRESKRRTIVFAIIALPLSYVAAKISSYFYYDARPFVVGNFTSLIPHAADNGFPSDHTLLASGLAGIILLFDKKKGAVLAGVAILVGVSRVLAGVHHATDIVGSMVIVSVVSFLTYKFLLPIALRAKK